MTTSSQDVVIGEMASRQRRRRLVMLHVVGLTYLVTCALAIPEVRASAMGGAIWIGVGTTLALLGLRLLGWRRSWTRARPPRRPAFSVHTWAGLVWVGVGAFGFVECLNTELPGTFCQIVGIGAPLSWWFFVIAFVFGVATLYGVLAAAMGSGLGIRPAGGTS